MPSASPKTAISIIGHRGASGTHPENTFAAFDQALNEGADGLELDLQLTRDGEVVVFHDHTLRKLGHPRLRVSALTLAELRDYDFGSWRGDTFRGETIPTLAQLLARYGARTELLLELKSSHDEARNRRLVRQTLAIMREAGVTLRAPILSFNAGMLRDMHEQAPDFSYVLNAFALRSITAGERQLPGLQAIDLDIRWLTPADRAALAASKHLYCYTCNSEAQLRAAANAGVAAVITNYPARSRAFLASLGKTTPAAR